MSEREEAIDGLYQGAFDAFTPARNALAKTLKDPSIKTLEKPSIAAWAVNQLYWHDRDVYDGLMRASEQLRGTHRHLLAGKAANVRESEQAHRQALRAAVDHVRARLQDGGHAVTDATVTAVQETLEALPSNDRPGRLVRPLKPLGFEALAGMAIKPAAAPSTRPTLRIVARGTAARAAAATTGGEPSQQRPKRASTQAERAQQRADAREQKRLQRERAREEQKRAEEERKRKEQRRLAEVALKSAEAAMLHAEEEVKGAERTLAQRKAARDEAAAAYQRARLAVREA